MQKRLTGILTAAVTAAAMLLPSASVHADDNAKKIVIIGDNIAYETALGIETFTKDSGAEFVLYTENHAHTDTVLAMLDRPEVQASLSEADYVLFTCGIYDIMDPFIEQADIYREQFGFEHFSDIFGAKMTDFGIKTEKELTSYCNVLARRAKENKLTAQSNVLAIGEKLSAYPSAKVIAINVYNPMDTIEQYDSLSGKRQLAYDTVSNPIKGVLNENINASYAQLGTDYGFTVVDSYALLQGKAYIYSDPENLHPELSIDGARMLGMTAAEALGLETNGAPPPAAGDVTGEGTPNASDAAQILIHAASIGAGKDGTLDAAQSLAANVNYDVVINASDAAKILIYAAVKGAGGDPEFGRL